MSLLSPTRLKIAANTGSQMIGKIISAGTTVAISFVVAKEFGAQGYGDFAKITTYVAFFFLLADFGLNAMFLQQKEKENFGALLSLRIFGGLLLIFIAVAILAFLPQGSAQGFTPLVRLGIIFFAPAILFQGFITTSNAVFQKHLRYDLATIALAAGSFITLMLLAFPTAISTIYNLQPTIFFPLLSLLMGSVVTSIVALLFTRRFLKDHPLTVSSKAMGALLFSSVPFGMTLFLNVIYTRADIFFLTLFRTTQEVGVYALAYKVFELPLVFPTFFMNAVYPLMINALNKDVGIVNHGLKKLIKISLFTLIPSSLFILLMVWVFAPVLTQINEDFVTSIPTLRILSLSLPLFFATSVTMWSLIALKKQGSLLAIYGISMIINVAANMTLVPVYGSLASAWITVASEGIVLVLSIIVLYKALNPRP